MSGFTPGPWIMAAKPSSVVGWPVVASTGRSIASIAYVSPDGFAPAEVDFNEQSKANAALIAAAPDLLSALEKAAPFIGWASTREQIIAGVDSIPLCDEIDAALAKARGEA